MLLCTFSIRVVVSDNVVNSAVGPDLRSKFRSQTWRSAPALCSAT